jgi:hypothetical protein
MRRFDPEDFRRHPTTYFESSRRRAPRSAALRRPPDDLAGHRLAVVLVWTVLGVGLVLSVLLLFGFPGNRPAAAPARAAAGERRPVVTVAAPRPAPAGWALALPFVHVEVSVRIDRPRPTLRVPEAAVLNRQGETQVAVVGADGALHYRKVLLGRALAGEVEVVEGLRPDEAVVTDMPGGLRDGAAVHAMSAAARLSVEDDSRGPAGYSGPHELPTGQVVTVRP